MGSLRVGHDWATSLSLFTFMHWRRKWQPTPVFLPGESQGRGQPHGLPSMRSHRVGHDWSDLAVAAAATAHEPGTSRCSSWVQKGRETRDQIANTHWIMEKAREFPKNIYFRFIDYTKAFDCVYHNKLWEILKENTRPPYLLLRNL